MLLTTLLAVASAASAAVVTAYCGGSGKDVEDPAAVVAFSWTEGATGCSAWVDRNVDGRPEAGAWVGGIQEPPTVGGGVAVVEKPGIVGASGGAGLAINEEGVQVYGGGGAGGMLFGVLGRNAASLGGGGSSIRLGPSGPSGHVVFGEGFAIHEEGVQVVGGSVGGGLAIDEPGVHFAEGGADSGIAINEEGVQIGSAASALLGITVNEEGVRLAGGGDPRASVRNASRHGPDSDADGVASTSARAGPGGASAGSSDARNATLAADGAATGADVGGTSLVAAEQGATSASAERSARAPRGVADGTARAATDEGASIKAHALGTGATCTVDRSTDPDVPCGDQ